MSVLLLLDLRRWLGNDVIILLWGQQGHHLMAVSSLEERGGVLFYDRGCLRVLDKRTCRMVLGYVVRPLFKQARVLLLDGGDWGLGIAVTAATPLDHATILATLWVASRSR